MLCERKMRKDESIMEYFLKIKEISNTGVIEDNAIIQYVIDGIQDLDINKTILYGAKSMSEFKEKLKFYENIHKKNKKTEVRSGKNEKVVRSETKNKQNSIRCYNCGELGHTSKVCQHKEKGMKCFKCNQFGHKSNYCRNNETVKPNVLCLNSKSTDLCKKIVKIKNQNLTALIDTGSKFNIIKENVYTKLSDTVLDKTNVCLMGFGKNDRQNKIKPFGSFDANVEIDNLSFHFKFLVVPSECMDYELIIGNEIFESAEVVINPSGISIKKLKHDENDEISAIMNISEYTENIEMNIDERVTSETKEKLIEMIQNYKPKKVKTTSVEMKIVLTDETPIYHNPRRLPFKEREFVEHQVDEWLRDGIIEPCSSEYSSQVVVTKKKNGNSRLCIDYRKINKNVVKDRFPLPLMDDVLDSLQNAKIFSTIDLRNGFFHVSVHPESRKYTSFVTHSGQYQFLKVPFGLSNSPAVFQRHINSIFRDLMRQGVALPYVDDIIIPASDNDEAIKRLKDVMQLAKDYGLDINIRKSSFLKRRVNFLGHQIENGKIYPSSVKTLAVKRFPTPTTKKQVESFLGLTGYFRKFVANYARIAKPLSDLTRKDAKFKFTEIEENSFRCLKQALSEEPVLSIFNQNFETELHTDASSDGYGAVLLQRIPEDGQFHPVFYMSRKTSNQEKKLHSYELECLAIVEALRKFRVYLLGLKFKLVTDCNAFQKTLDKKDLTPKVARWVMLLEEFDYIAEHRTANRMRHVDALSRCPIYTITEIDPVLKFKKAQDEDDELKVIREILKEKDYDGYFLKTEVLYKWEGEKELLVVPNAMQHEIIRKAHENGHFGAKKIKEIVSREYYIPKLEKKIHKVVANCVACIMINRKRGKKEGELHPLNKEELPLYTYHIDFLGPLESTNKNYNHILAIVDSFTKFVWLYPTRTTSTKEVINKLDVQKGVFGNPLQIVSDRGSAFTSSEFQQYCDEEGIKHLKVTTGLPRANGQVERLNSIIISVLSKLSIENPAQWYKHVSRVQQSINSTYQHSIGVTPFELLTGVKMRTKDDLKLRDMIEGEVLQQFNDNREDLRRDAKKQILEVQNENKRGYNLRRRPAFKYNIGDLVVIKRTQGGVGLKLKAKFLGPYRVTGIKGNDTYTLQRAGYHGGPTNTTSCAEYMKPWPTGDLLPFEANVLQDGRDMGC